MTDIRIYADYNMATLLEESEVYSLMSHDCYEFIGRYYTDRFDGTDRWELLINAIERKYPNAWRLVVLSCGNDLSYGQMYTRDKHYLKDKSFVFLHSRPDLLFLFGVDETRYSSIETLMSGSIQLYSRLENLDRWSVHIPGSIDNTLLHVVNIIECKHKGFEDVWIVLNPDPRGVLALRLAEPYKIAVTVSGDRQYYKIVKIKESLDFYRINNNSINQLGFGLWQYSHFLQQRVNKFIQVLSKHKDRSEKFFYKNFVF